MEKSIQFEEIPSVLRLYFLCFEYDHNLSQNRKLNDSFAFDYHFELNEFPNDHLDRSSLS